MITAVFSAASRATCGNTLVWKSLCEACRSMCCTTFVSTPAASAMVAAP